MNSSKMTTGKATFAGGCFWCMVMPFDVYEGVISVISGYIGGHLENPSYEDVCSGSSGHYEAVEILFDPELISYEELLTIYWQQVDPTDRAGQFSDRGTSYRTAIFYHDEKQLHAAKASLADLEASGRFARPIVTEILPATTFYPAEEYHQNYARRQAESYASDKAVIERKQFLKGIWG